MSITINQRLSILFFIQYIIWGGWMVTLGSYLLKTLEFSGQQVGYIYGCVAIAATISPFAMGVLADQRFRLERLIAFLHFSGGVVMIACTFCKTFTPFYVLFLLYTLLYLPTFSLTNSLAFRHIKDIENDFPKIRVWGTASWIFTGLIISVFVWEEKVYPLYMSAIVSFVMAAYSLTLPNSPPIKDGAKKHWIKSLGLDLWPYFKKRSLIFLLLTLMLIRLASAFYYSFVNPYMLDLDISFPTAKMTLGQLTEILIMLAMPFMMKRFRAKWILSIGFFFWGFRYWLFDFGSEDGFGWMIYVAILAHGVTFNFGNLAAQIYIDRMVPERLRSTAQGLAVLITMGIGVLIGSYFAGWVVDTHTVDGVRVWDTIWDYPFWSGIIVFILFLIFYPNREIKNVDEPKEMP